MTSASWNQGFVICFRLTMIVILACGGCNQTEISSLDSESDMPLDVVIEGAPVEDQVAIIEIPNGTPAELFEFLERLDAKLQQAMAPPPTDAPGPSNEDRSRVIRQVMRGRIAACDKILAADIDEATRQRAVGIQLDAWRTLVALDPQDLTEPFQQFTDRLIHAEDPVLARAAKATRFQVHIDRALAIGQLDNDKVLAELNELLGDPDAGAATFIATREAASWLLQHGQIDLASRTLRRVGQRFRQHADVEIASEAQSLIDESYKLDLTQLAQAVAENQTGASDELQQNLTALLTEDLNDAEALGFALQTAQLLEYSGSVDDALKIYRAIGRAYQDPSASELAADVQHSLGLAERRLSLMGQQIDIEGVSLNGTEFDWDTYRDKWVIVCFWATWNQGWLNEVDNIRQALAAHPDCEVEVVAISLDDDRNHLERFLKEHPTSWPVLINSDSTALGFENPNAVRCGVEAVPFIVLVDPTGEVADIHLMGDRLMETLSKSLGDG